MLKDPRTCRAPLTSVDHALFILGEALEELEEVRATGEQLKALHRVLSRLRLVTGLLSGDEEKRG